MSRSCPYPTCGRSIDDDLFACGYHWRRLPQSIRSGINRAFARYRRDRSSEAALNDLIDAQRAAQDHWRV